MVHGPSKSSCSRASCRAQIQLISIERLSFCASGIDADFDHIEDATNTRQSQPNLNQRPLPINLGECMRSVMTGQAIDM